MMRRFIYFGTIIGLFIALILGIYLVIHESMKQNFSDAVFLCFCCISYIFYIILFSLSDTPQRILRKYIWAVTYTFDSGSGRIFVYSIHKKLSHSVFVEIEDFLKDHFKEKMDVSKFFITSMIFLGEKDETLS